MAKEEKPPKEAYIVNKRYLFKTGFDSYVSGTIKYMFDGEVTIRDAQIQIPISKLDKFLGQGAGITDQATHSEIILHKINIDWAVPIR